MPDGGRYGDDPMSWEPVIQQINLRFDQMHRDNTERFAALNRRLDAADRKLDEMHGKMRFWGGGLAVIGMVFGVVSSFLVAKARAAFGP